MFTTIGFLNKPVYEEFAVVSLENVRITGLLDSNFTKELYDPDNVEVSSSISVTVSELGNGNYRASFTPNKKGNWLLTIYNSTYFPLGKAGTIKVQQYELDEHALETTSQLIKIETDKIVDILSKLDDIEISTNDNKDIILQLREGNVRRVLTLAAVQNVDRKVAVGKLDYITIDIKNDTDVNWDTPVSTKRLYCWYLNMGDTNPVKIGEIDP